MTAPIESSYAPPPSSGTGPAFRVVQFQTVIGGVPTTVDVEGILLIGADGRPIFKPGDSDQMLSAILSELRGIRMQLAALTGHPAEVVGMGG